MLSTEINDYLEQEFIKASVTKYAGVVVISSATGDINPIFYGNKEEKFYLASLTKLFTAYGILIAVNENHISLEEVVGENGAQVSHLLNHTSGLGPNDSEEYLFAPAQKRIYSNYGFEVLAKYLENKLALKFADYLQSKVFHPLGMFNTQLSGPAGFAAYSTAVDLSKFIAELLFPQLLPKDVLSLATSTYLGNIRGVLPGFGSFKDNSWGLGFEVHGSKSPHWLSDSQSEKTFGHFGKTGCYLWIDPVVHSGMVLLMNKDFGAWAKENWPKINEKVSRLITIH